MRLCLAICLAALPNVATADLSCVFESECLEGESCVESGFAVTVFTSISPGATLPPDAPEPDRIVTDAETISVTWGADGDALAAFGTAPSGFVMLSLAADGRARYTAHLPSADLSLTYIGQCVPD